MERDKIQKCIILISLIIGLMACEKEELENKMEEDYILTFAIGNMIMPNSAGIPAEGLAYKYQVNSNQIIEGYCDCVGIKRSVNVNNGDTLKIVGEATSGSLEMVELDIWYGNTNVYYELSHRKINAQIILELN